MKTLSFDITVPGECMGGCKKCFVGTVVKPQEADRMIPIGVWDSLEKILDLQEYRDYDGYTISLSRISRINWGSLSPLVHLSPLAVNIAVGTDETNAHGSMSSFLSSFFPKVDTVNLIVAQGASDIQGQIQELEPLCKLAMELLKTGKYKRVGISTGVNDVSTEEAIKNAIAAYARIHYECGMASKKRSKDRTVGKAIIDTLEENGFSFAGLTPNREGHKGQQFHKDEQGRLFTLTTSVRTLPEGHKGVPKEVILGDLEQERIAGPLQRQFMFVGNMVNFHHSHHTRYNREGENPSWATVEDFLNKILGPASAIGYVQARIKYLLGD